MKVTLAQKKLKLGDKENNLTIIENVAESQNSDLLVFPEMFLTGYSLRDRLWDEAERVPGPSTDRIADIAVDQDTAIVLGMPERGKNKGRLYNVGVLATSDGKVNKYRKTYLPNFGPFEEMRYFKGDDDLPVFDTPFGKVGITICYDIFFPEITKAMAMKGAEIIVCISASPSISREFFENVLPARAIETTSFILYSNLIGREDNLTFWGGDTMVSPKGDVVAKGPYYEEALVEKEIDLSDIQGARKGRPVLSDTRRSVIEKNLDF